MAQTETFDPKRYTPFEAGVRTEKVLSTFPAIDTAVDNIKFSQGLEHIAQVMDRGTLIRTFQARRPRLHPALAAPVPLAHRLRAAADGRVPAHRRGGRADARAEESGRPAVHQHRPATWRSAAESEELKAFHTGGLPRARSTARSNLPIRRTPRPPCGRRPDDSATRGSRAADKLYKQLLAREPGLRARRATTSTSRCSGRWTTPTGC